MSALITVISTAIHMEEKRLPCFGGGHDGPY